ncbi:MAG TPA: zinc-binding dehydrogenase [Jiangellaceae bacterium]|nr:zinc-binding dehydrogenase [Jiangellaceae bacterium]
MLHQDELGIIDRTYAPGPRSRVLDIARLGRMRPVVAATYRLSDVHRAQADLASRGHIGKLILVND